MADEPNDHIDTHYNKPPEAEKTDAKLGQFENVAPEAEKTELGLLGFGVDNHLTPHLKEKIKLTGTLPHIPIIKPAAKPGSKGAYYDSSSNDVQKGWPLPKFYFDVNFGSTTMGFQTCDGLEATIEPYEFRDGNSSNFWKEKRPGMASFGAITLKKGMFIGDSSMYSWFKNVSTGSSFGDKRTVTINLKDEGGSNVFTWVLEKAFITKFTPTTMDADAGEEVAVEEMEITCTSWTQSSGGGGVGGLLSSIAGALGLGGALSAIGSISGSLGASVKIGF